MTTNKQIQIKRSWLATVLLSLTSYGYRGVEQTQAGFKLLGKDGKRIPLSDLADLPKATKVLWFQCLYFPLKSGTGIKIVGLSHGKIASFISTATSAIRDYLTAEFDKAENDLRETIQLIKNPQQYPSACLLEPSIAKASAIMSNFLTTIPENTLAGDKQRILEILQEFLADPQHMRELAIKSFTKNELNEMQDFLDTVESNPLTPEQRLAVVTDEDATLILAGAGSGKTSVIVAKAAYLIKRGIRKPNEVLLMAYSKKVDKEMTSRIEKIPGKKIDALTFHALGKKIIRDVEGKVPTIADHATDDAKFRKHIHGILISEAEKNNRFNSLLLQWFSDFFSPTKSEWDFKTKKEYDQYVSEHELRTLNGDLVRSFEELLISNWLYRKGVAYEYEPNYEHEVPGSRYRPDFRLTESGVYIEHFGVREVEGPEGEIVLTTAPHIDRERYLKGMKWKRELHETHGTTLIETFSHEQVKGNLIKSLKEKIKPYVMLKPLSQDRIFDPLKELGKVDEFTQTIATFLRQFKNAGATIADCQKRDNTSRAQAFLEIFGSVLDIYENHPKYHNHIDFEDMINRAAEHVEAGRYESPYKHLLVDEFQDISKGRARLLKALKAQHEDARLFAVGDDWQSIYRFAGSDIYIMRGFGQEFGGKFAGKIDIHCTIDLGRTFRSVDKIALPARRFVLQNTAQIDKNVITVTHTDEAAIMIAYYKDREYDTAFEQVISNLATKNKAQTGVLLLGRYKFLKPKNLDRLNSNYPSLSITFKTMHASKGLEDDHVVILRAESGPWGFPSEKVDDSLLDLVLPESEKFEHAEERRVFYVALTRARKSVTILTSREKPSAFVMEMIKDPKYEIFQQPQRT